MTPPCRPLLMLVTEPHPRLGEIVADAVAGGVDIVQWRESPPPTPPVPEVEEESLIPSPSPAEESGRRRQSVDRHTLVATGSVERRLRGRESEAAIECPTSSCGAGALYPAIPTPLPPVGGVGGGLFPALRAAVAPPARLIVNARTVEALPDGADGLHLPEHGISTAEARRRYGEQILIGRSVHGIESALQAELDGADYLIAGTIFASNSHPGETPAGLDFLRAVCAAVRIPVIAIGGITPANAPDCIAAGAAGVAVLSPIMRAGDPRQVTEDYRRALGTRTCPP